MPSSTITTPGDSTFTVGSDCPSTVTALKLEYWGAGAGGGADAGVNNGGGGGGGYGRIDAYPVTDGLVLSVTVSNGGIENIGPDVGNILGPGDIVLLYDNPLAIEGAESEAGSGGSVASIDYTLDVALDGGPGWDASGSTSGGGGGSSAGTALAGVGATNASGATAPTGGGNGGNGGAALANGANGASPGGGGGGAGDGALTHGGTGGNGKAVITWLTAPAFTNNGGLASILTSGVEGTTAVTTLTASGTLDLDFPFQLVGGADQNAFALDTTTGVLALDPGYFSPDAAPDYENPIDADTNNTYVAIVRVTNSGGYDEQAITHTITNDTGDDAGGFNAAWARGSNVLLGMN